MTQIADDRSWWADVEHLRPGAVATAATPSTAVAKQPAPADLIDLDRPAPVPGGRFQRGPADAPPLRRGRITGRPVGRDDDAEPVLRRADVASFADAMDLDGAFGAPTARRAESREIVLTGLPATDDGQWVEDQLWDEPGAAARTRPAADLWTDDGDLWEEPARRQPNPSQTGLWDDDELWVEPARRRGADAGPAAAPPSQADRGTRRTVHIGGGPVAPGPDVQRRPLREIEPSRPRQGAVDRISYDPDRIAMWAVVLGILLVLIAASSSLT